MTSASFAYPWLVLAFPLLVILPFVRRAKFQYIPVTRCVHQSNGATLRLRAASWVLPLIRMIFLLLLVLSAARPQIKTELPFDSREKRNIILALDVSRSMEARDFISSWGITTRMQGVQRVTSAFIENRRADRIGLVLFGSHAFLQSPLTADHNFLRTLLVDLRPGVAGDGTAIGEGIGTALKHIQALPADTKAVILLTDGVNTSGTIEPIKAARIASNLGVRVYTIGIGSTEGAFLPSVRGIPLSQRVSAGFDESALRRISEITGAQYYFASNEDELNRIYEEIESLERTEVDIPPAPVTTQELAQPLLFASLLLFLVHFLLSQTLLKVLP